MTLPIGAHVEILANAVHPHLEGRIGVIVSFTKPNQPCGITHDKRYRKSRCGGNYILEIAGMGRFLLRPDDVSVCTSEARSKEKPA